MTDLLVENNRRVFKTLCKETGEECFKPLWCPIKYNNNKHNMSVLYKSWKKYNEFQLTKNKIDLNTWKWKIIHPPPSEESHPMTDPLGKTLDKIGDSLSLPNLMQ